MKLLIRLLSALPIRLLHSLGAVLGPLALVLDRRARQQLQQNADLASDYLQVKISTWEVKKNLGKRIMEMPWLWLRSYAEIAEKITISLSSAACVAKPQATIFLTPHLGSFEVTAMYIASVRPITVMYRTPKVVSLLPYMMQGRSKGMADAVPADLSGVRAMLASLRAGNSIGLLPDQVPSSGDGEIVPFLGKPARTISLVYNLAKKTGARVVMSVAVFREGQFHLSFEELNLPLSSVENFLTQMNIVLEQTISKHPNDYLWTYKRFKGVNNE